MLYNYCSYVVFSIEIANYKVVLVYNYVNEKLNSQWIVHNNTYFGYNKLQKARNSKDFIAEILIDSAKVMAKGQE